MGTKAGDSCECGGRFATRTSKQAGDSQVRYLRCPVCGKTTRTLIPREQLWRTKKVV